MPNTAYSDEKSAVSVPVLENGQAILMTDLLREMTEQMQIQGKQKGMGKRKNLQGRAKGKHRGNTLSGTLRRDSLDLSATLRSAALHCRECEEMPVVRIRPGDLRFKRFIPMEKTGTLFVVDASRSQGADRRLAFAKGAILSLLNQIYCRRDYVGLIVFGNKKAQLVLPFTKSVEYAARKLTELPAMGNTPLAMGLQTAVRTVAGQRKKGEFSAVMLVVVTDGKANYDERVGKPFELALAEAEIIRRERIPAVVIDTQRGVFNLGFAQKLARAMEARYLTME